MVDDTDYGIGERVPWGSFPPIVCNGHEGRLKDLPGYDAAKRGDGVAAVDLVESVFLQETADQILDRFEVDFPILLPVLAQESSGRNKLPIAFAEVLSERTGLSVETDIVATDVVQRTSEGADHRLAFSPRFVGTVVAGQKYVILDDASTMGGTIASLRGFVENRGGHVVSAAVLSARPNALDLKPSDRQLDHIRQRFGNELDSFWREVFGYGIECATRAEAGHVRRAESIESIRDRIAQARDVGFARLHARASESAKQGRRSGDMPDKVHRGTAPLESIRIQAERLAREQRALVETASVEQIHSRALAEHVLAKQAQLHRVEDRLGKAVANQRSILQQTTLSAPGLITLPSTRSRWRASESAQRARLQALVKRLDWVRGLKPSDGEISPRIELLARRRLHFKQPDLVSEWERARAEGRRRHLEARQQGRAIERESGRTNSPRRLRMDDSKN